MSRQMLIALCMVLASFNVLAQNLSEFQSRFGFIKNDQGQVTAIRLKKAITRFTVKPFLDQIKSELLSEQQSFNSKSLSDKEAQIDEMLLSFGVDPYAKENEGDEEIRNVKESLLNIPNINVEESFRKISSSGLWAEFETRLKDAMMFIDPTILTNHEDARFFYKKNVTYKVVTWALGEAQKRFSDVPLLNIASFVIVRIHDMMLEQRIYHHNMLLHYFETVPETKLGLTKEEVDRAISSIYEYRIEATNLPESNRAARDWLNYGQNNFYAMVRAGNNQGRRWTNSKKLNFAFAEVNENGARKIYHLHVNSHKFSSKPALAYNYAKPNQIKTNRALLSLAGVGVGFLTIPGWIKDNVQSFLKSLYVNQARFEGALTGYFDTTGDRQMSQRIFAQRSNFYIVD